MVLLKVRWSEVKIIMLAVKVINVCSISNLANHLERKWSMGDHLTPNDKNASY